MKRYLVTGGAGFVASHLAERLAAEKDSEVVIVDNMLTGEEWKVPQLKNVIFVKADVNDYRDMSAIFSGGRFDMVFHYAAVVGVKRTLANPNLVLQDIEGIKNMLDLSKNTGVKRFYFSSSSEVYGESFEYPQHEESTPLNSRLPYAIVKNVGEAFARSYYQEFGLEYTILRFFNTYGPKQSEDFVVSKFVRAALKNEDIIIYGDGSQSRTFCYIDDNIEATMNSLSDPKSVNSVINIGNDIEVSVDKLADVIIKATGSKSKKVYVDPLKEGDMARRQPHIAKMKEVLGRDMTSLDEGIGKLLDFHKTKK